jgi:hypothetical protein
MGGVLVIAFSPVMVFFLGPLCIGSGCTSPFKAYCATLNIYQHGFIISVSLTKRQTSLTEAVLNSFGSASYFPKILALSSQCITAASDELHCFSLDPH